MLLIAKFRLKLKKIGKITRPFRYDLNQIPRSEEHTSELQSQMYISYAVFCLPGADCGSDYELLIAKFRLKLKKIGKTTR